MWFWWFAFACDVLIPLMMILLPSVLILLPAYSATENTIAIVFLAVETVQMIFMVYPMVQTERALKESFNDDGSFKK